MTVCALWSGLSIPANSFTFSADRLTAINGGTQGQAIIGLSVTSGRFRLSFQYVSGSGTAVGVGDTASLVAGVNPTATFQVYSGAGELKSDGSTVTTFGAPSSGAWIDFVIDTGSGSGSSGTKQGWARINGGLWNNSSSANPDTNTGGISLSYISAFTPFSLAYGTGSTPTTVINTGGSPYAYTMPATFSDLPATLAVNLPAVVTPGSTLNFSWTSGNLSGLNYSLNGGTFTACSGTTTGSSGTAIGPTIGSAGAYSIVLQNASNTLDQTPVIMFPAFSPPSGAGSLVTSTAYNIVNPGSEYQITGTLSTPLNDLIFTWYQEVDCSVTGTANGSPSFDLEFSSSGTTANLTVAAGAWTATDGTPGYNDVYLTVPLVSGPGTVTIGFTDSVSGTLASTSDGTLTGYASNNGTAVLCQRTSVPQQTYTGWIIGTGVMYPFVPSVTFRGYMGIWALAAPETLTITSASYEFGTLSIGGQVENASLTTLSVSTNSGATFLSAGSLTVAAPNYEAELYGPLPSATYTLQTQDSTTGTVSNLYELTISNGETIYLSSASGTIGGTLSLTGTYGNEVPAGLNYTLDAGIGATYEATSNYEPEAYAPNGTWTASGNTLTATGTFPTAVQDSVNGLIVSNTVELVVTEPLEQLTLTVAQGVAGGLLSIGGVSNYGPPGGMNVSLNAGSTWFPVSNFSSGTGTVSAAFGGLGPTLAAGTYEVQVEDPTTTPITLSNILPLVVTGSGSTSGGYSVGVIPNWTANDFLQAFLNLLPRGRAWPKFAAAVQTQVMGALMPSLVRLCQSAASLLIDGFPATTVQLIPEWEKSLGLPDKCTPLGATIAQQQASILQKFTGGGSQTVAYYIAVAAELGYDITITEQAADTFTWTVNAAEIAPPVLFRVGKSRAGDSLELIVSNAQLECVLQNLKPAHTTLLFSYT